MFYHDLIAILLISLNFLISRKLYDFTIFLILYYLGIANFYKANLFTALVMFFYELIAILLNIANFFLIHKNILISRKLFDIAKMLWLHYLFLILLRFWYRSFFDKANLLNVLIVPYVWMLFDCNILFLNEIYVLSDMIDKD